MATETLNPASSATGDYFAVFGLPRKLNLDVAGLEKEFLRQSRKLHPDLYAQKSPEEQAWSLEQTSRLNDAYRTLKDPITRTQYLLKLEGVQLEEQSKAATEAARASGEEKKQAVPPDLLEEVFELNMQLEELRMSKQAGQADEDAVRGLRQAKQSFEARLNALGDELKQLWSRWDSAVSEADRISARDAMVDLLNRRSYIRNLVRDVNQVLND